MNIKIKLKKIKKRQSRFQHDMNMLKDEKIRLEYNILVENKFNRHMSEETIQIDTEQKIEHMWNALKESMTRAAEEVLPKAKRKISERYRKERK